MKLEEYRQWVSLTDITSKNQLLARIAETFDEMDKWADMDWSRVELTTESESLEYQMLCELYPGHEEVRSLSVTVPGLPDELPDEVSTEA